MSEKVSRKKKPTQQITINNKVFAQWLRKTQGELQSIYGIKFSYVDILFAYILRIPFAKIKEYNITPEMLPSPLLDGTIFEEGDMLG